jgi:hypothetical protein
MSGVLRPLKRAGDAGLDLSPGLRLGLPSFARYAGSVLAKHLSEAARGMVSRQVLMFFTKETAAGEHPAANLPSVLVFFRKPRYSAPCRHAQRLLNFAEPLPFWEGAA